MPVDFYYKGLMDENEFFPYTPEQSADRAKGSMYEAWFDTLKASPWYIKMCETREFPSESAKECYEKFGDVRPFSFKTWWLRTGYEIFAERVRYEGMQAHEVTATTSLKFNKGEDEPSKLIVEVPLNIDPRKLKEQFDQILRDHSNYYDHKNRHVESTAPVPFDRDRKLDYVTIKLWIDVYKNVELARTMTRRESALYEVCRKMKLRNKLFADFFEGSDIDDPKIKQKAASAVDEYYQKALRLMANATEMVFPSVENNYRLMDIQTRNRE